MIGSVIVRPTSVYTIKHRLTDGKRANAEIYLCEDRNDNKFILKQFTKPPSPLVGLSQYNHYGRRRDGSQTVFNEIQEMNQSFPFLVRHIDRFRCEDKWVILMDYVPGVTVREYIYSHQGDKLDDVKRAIAALAFTLSTWHSNGFAHGDPHLDNAILKVNELGGFEVVFIDYSQIHHKDFHYCKSFQCFSRDANMRIKEDLQNDSAKLGSGFRSELVGMDQEMELDGNLVEAFDNHYVYS